MNCGAWHVVLSNLKSMRTFREGASVDDVLRSLRAAGEPGRRWLEELPGLTRTLVQHQRRRWLLSLSPQLE